MEKIEGKPNYSVSDCGDVRNDKTGRILKKHIGTSGYYQVMLGRKTTPLYVHRLVGKAFLENPCNLPQIDHINGIKTDNRVCNLRWVSASENCMNFGYKKRIENRKKKICASNGETKIIFSSRNECAEFFKCSKSCIEYNRLYSKGLKKGWILKLVEDIV
jgi:hypothetical protein